MTQRPDLPKDISDKIDSLLKQAGIEERSGDFRASEKYSLQAWDLLPEPKLGWNFYSNIMPRDNLILFRDTHQWEKANHWLDITRQSYGPGRDASVEFIAATLWFEMGDFDRAWEEFDRQFKAGKTRPFQGKDKKYLDFYLSRKGKK